jgi:hypothetical protein
MISVTPHSRSREDRAGDPLDGLVNLFDIGIVLAVAFLIAGLGLTLDTHSHTLRVRPAAPAASSGPSGTLPPSSQAPAATGRGQPVGTVYRLSNGQLVYVVKPNH